jgi:hypothetical protein
MKSWKITYVVVEDETNYRSGIESKIKSIEIPSPEQPENGYIITKLNELLCTDENKLRVYAVGIEFIAEIGYKNDDIA